MNTKAMKYYVNEYSVKTLGVLMTAIVYFVMHSDIEFSVYLKIQDVYEYIYSLSLDTHIPEILLIFGFLFALSFVAKRWNDKYDSILFNVLCGLAIMALLLTKENWRYIYVFGSNYIDVCDCICFLLVIRLVFPLKKWWTFCDSTIIKIFKTPKDNDVPNIDKSRELYAKAIIDDLNQRDLSGESFAVGICGEWGTGKTTFLKHIEKNLSEGNNITYSYNVWKSYTPDNIIKDFFSGLANVLSPYYSRLKKPLLKYADALTAIHADSSLSYLVSLIQPDCSTESLRNDIKDSLSKINKRIFVLFDDIDRLSKEELFEVLRLIRNTANFPNIVYLVTYDKNYVAEQIKALNINEQYLNKIFMLELTLPKLVDNPQITYLYQEIDERVNDSSARNAIYKVLNENYIALNAFFLDMRQCERFANQLFLDVNFVTDKERFSEQVYHIEDLFWIELLKFYDRKTYLLLQNNPDEILEHSTNTFSRIAVFELRKAKQKNEKLESLSDNTEVILNKLFYKAKDFLPNYKNRMAFIENYYKYFSLGLASTSIEPAEYYSLINDKKSFDDIHRKIFLEICEKRKVWSIINQISLTYTFDMTIDQAKNFASIILSLKYWKVHNNNILQDKLFPKIYNESIYDELSSYIKEIIDENITKYPVESAGILNQLLKCIGPEGEYMSYIDYTSAEITDKIKSCVKTYLENNKCDASDVIHNSSPLYNLFKASVTSDYVIDSLYDGPIEYCNFAFEEFLNFFNNHKSNDKDKVKQHFKVDDDIPEEYRDDELERMDDLIRSIFGTHDNYKKYLDECFE